jgi:hypothetical protein
MFQISGDGLLGSRALSVVKWADLQVLIELVGNDLKPRGTSG